MVNVGIVGSGFGRVGLLPAFEGIRGCRVVAFSNRTGLNKNRKGITQYTDWRLLLKHKGLNAVALAVPPRIQYEIARAALSEGLSVFAEKPLAATVQEAKELLMLAKRKQVAHAVDFIFPEIPAWKTAKKILDQEKLGALHYLSIQWEWLAGDLKYGRTSWKTSVSEGGGALAFYGSHMLNSIEFFAGPICDLSSLFTHSLKSRNGGEVGVDLLFTSRTGVKGNAHLSCNAPGRIAHQLIFECERGVLVLANENAVTDNFTLTSYDEKGKKHIRTPEPFRMRDEDERVQAVQSLAKRFIKACEKGGRMTPSFIEGVRVQELIELVRTQQYGKN